MGDVVRSIDIDAPPEAVWSLVARFEHWPSWGPTVSDVRATGDEVGVGVRGSVRTPFGIWLPFEITECESERSWSWRVAGIRATGHRLTPLADGGTRVRFSAPVGWAPYAVVLDRGLRCLAAMAEEIASTGPATSARVDRTREDGVRR